MICTDCNQTIRSHGGCSEECRIKRIKRSAQARIRLTASREKRLNQYIMIILKDRGYTRRRIAELLGVHHGTVAYWTSFKNRLHKIGDIRKAMESWIAMRDEAYADKTACRKALLIELQDELVGIQQMARADRAIKLKQFRGIR